jgi:GT2 family glycosyltransferase
LAGVFHRAVCVSQQVFSGQRSLGSAFRAARIRLNDWLAHNPDTRLQWWYAENAPGARDLRAQRTRFWPEDAPSISILLPCAPSVRDLLPASLASLKRQTYPNWTVVLVVEPAQAGLIRDLAGRIVGPDRVKLAVPQSANPEHDLQTALQAAEGDFVGVMSPGDEISPNALYEFARLLFDQPGSEVVYCDEDCFDPGTGRRHGLKLKPAWSPEMLLGHNYVGRLCLYRRTLLTRSGGFDGRLRGAQDYDAILRVSEQSPRVRRISRCLYHRRAAREFAGDWSRWDGAEALQAEALRRHMRRRGQNARIELQPDGTHRLTWPIVEPPLVSVVIPTKDNPSVLKTCVDGLLTGTNYPRVEVVLVDNGSRDPEVLGYYADLSARRVAKVVSFDRPFNYSAACNVGAKAATGNVLLFLNNDTEVIRPDWLEEMVRFCLLPGVGVVGTKLLYPDGLVQHAGVVFGMHVFCGHVYHRAGPGHCDAFGSPEMYRNLLAVTGACQMLSRSVFDEVGGFDERYRLAFSDVMLCLRAWQAGYRNVYTPYAAMRHHEGHTRGAYYPPEDAETFAADMQALQLDDDPYFHPALSPRESNPTLRLKPLPGTREALAQSIAEFAGGRSAEAGLRAAG